MSKDTGYFSEQHSVSRRISLADYGHCSSFVIHDLHEEKYVIEVVRASYISKQCWELLCNSALSKSSEILDLNVFIDGEFFRDEEPDPRLYEIEVHQFFFEDPTLAKEIAFKVSDSAMNKRKRFNRELRLYKAGGWHNREVINTIFEIQEGKCYYSGEPLCKDPKNYVIEHIHPVVFGGSDWPTNLALVLKEINTWKGGLRSPDETLRYIAKTKGKNWLNAQISFCDEVDKRRAELDREFKNHQKNKR